MSKDSKKDFRFDIPTQGDPLTQKANQISEPSDTVDEDISLFYLLQHYNKSNAEAYKRKKEREKQAKLAKQAKGQLSKQKEMKNQSEVVIPTEEQEQKRNMEGSAGSYAYEAGNGVQKDRIAETVDSSQPSSNINQKQNFGKTVFIRRGEERFVSKSSQEVEEPIQPACLKLSESQSEQSASVSPTFFMTSNEPNKTVFWEQKSEPQKTATMRNIATMATTRLCKTPFRIGRNPGLVDLVIENNLRISGLHAEIGLYKNNFFIVDKSSLNGVFLNGTRIEPETEYILESGMIVAFANEQFVFEVD